MVILSIGLTVFGLQNNWAWNSSSDDNTASYSLLTYNVRLFDLYNWLDGKAWDEWKERTDNGAVLDSLKATIIKPNPDFICFQEYFSQDKGDYQIEKYFKKQGYRYSHLGYTLVNKPNKYGIATFSKYPIIRKETKFFRKSGLNNGILISDIKTTLDTLRLINVHLESYRLGKNDYKYLNTISDSSLASIEAEPAKDLMKRIKGSFERRREQMNFLMDEIKNSPYPVVLCGDFNELPNSYLYNSISKLLSDGFQEVGWGLGSTLTNNIPGLRIDYVFHSDEIKPVSHHTIKKELSDHYPVLFKFKNVQ